LRSSIRKDAFANGDDTLGLGSTNSIMSVREPEVRSAPVLVGFGLYVLPNLYFSFGSTPRGPTK
jgi:hypothetical protein